MKQYFEKLEKLGKQASKELAAHDAAAKLLIAGYKEELQSENWTREGYERAVEELARKREAIKSRLRDDVEALEREFAEATDQYMTPSAGRYHVDDAEILKNFKLSTREFESMAKKYEDNPTMLRLLEKYRVEHDVQTSWRLQSGDDRKESFSLSCAGLLSCVDPKYRADCDEAISRSVSNGYHRLQGSDPNVFPIGDGKAPGIYRGESRSSSVPRIF